MPDSASFTCNLCGKICERSTANFGREVPSCTHCGSTVRLRGLVALLSREFFGVEMALPDFPVTKGVRGIGMSDPPSLAAGLAEKFDYSNTFYHQPPYLDITQPSNGDMGRYDFIVSSEVMEHVPPPVEPAFANLFRMLKPDGLLLLSVPYKPDGRTEEHFPELHEYGLVSLGGRTVLVNRRRDGSTEVFEGLCFHGSGGSTLEMRRYSEASLLEILAGAGFSEIRIAAESVPEFGVDHSESWSLPITARKGHFHLPPTELAVAYKAARQALDERLAWVGKLEGELEKRTQWALELDHEMEARERVASQLRREHEERLAWVRKLEGEFEERTQWALALRTELDGATARVLALQKELDDTKAAQERGEFELRQALDERLAWVRKLEGEFEERTQWALSMRKELDDATASLLALRKEMDDAVAARKRFDSLRWTRIGRKLGFIP